MSETQNILIVDDREENIFALEKTLKGVEANIIHALSGNEALRVVVNNPISLAILDVQMPDMDGYELAELLRGDAKTHHVPIIFMSAVYSDDFHVFKGYEAGAVDFIVKPYNPDHLLSKVYAFLELDRVRTSLEEKVGLLAASEERFRSLVRTIPDIVYRINEEGDFTYINDAVAVLGYEPADLIGNHFSTIIHPEDVNLVSRKAVLPEYKGKKTGDANSPKLFDEMREGNRKTVALEIRLLTKNAKKNRPGKSQDVNSDFIIAEVNSSGMYSNARPGGHKVFLGTVGVIRDITVRKKVENELVQYRNHLEDLVKKRTRALRVEIKEREHAEVERKKLEQRMVQQQRLESVGTLAGGVAHEINNPINGIMNYAQLILDQDANGTSKENYAKSIIEETKRVSVIVRNLLQFARQDNPTIRGEVPVSEMIDYVLSLIKTIIRHDQIILQVEIPEDVPKAYCKSSEIEQVLMNLLTNARDALNDKYEGYHENKMILISASSLEQNGHAYARITIEDRGIGISKTVKEHIFEPFYTTKDRTKGTGLGLSISHGIVSRHGGMLHLETSVGEYTKFHLDLPVVKEVVS